MGNDTLPIDKAGDVDVDIDLFHFSTEHIMELLNENGFSIPDALELPLYEDVEWATKRTYIWTEKK